ncbi:uncharacterized protein VTP21DRAFT_7636 [Calcarisporiella thermophila]|uniref:uncharacterized protein n=1 Tax=Calcarisporiella thermophila TaxID=911321 RepID=UPI00374307AE
MTHSLSPGEGHITTTLHHTHALLTRCASAYPLKLIAPKSYDPKTSLIYALGYGGGLVSGDSIRLNIEVGAGTRIVMLTQGNTKVFKRRKKNGGESKQELDARVEEDAILLLLPDPVTCFAESSYQQVQRVRLEGDGSLLIMVDWVTSGRMSRGEKWAGRYASKNEVYHKGELIVRDSLVLDEATGEKFGGNLSCYATVLVVGGGRSIEIGEGGSKEDVWWSTSPVAHGCVVRICGMQTEAVRDVLRGILRHAGALRYLNEDAFARVF